MVEDRTASALPDGPDGGQAAGEEPTEEEILEEVLREAQRQGWVGSGPLSDHLAQAAGFFYGRPGTFDGWSADLGSGGGLPGLPLALAYPMSQWLLVDAWERRTDALERAVGLLDLAHRVQVRHARAEDLGRGLWRGFFDVVVARGLGPPAVTAECGAPLLRVGGELIVSDVGGEDRWPEGAVARVGLSIDGWWTVGRFAYVRLVQERACPEEFPRRSGVPARRPLF